VNGQPRYIIRESYRQAGQFLSRDLLELGADPGSYIAYPGGNAFYIDQVIEERITEMGAQANPDEIEDIFWPFVDPEIRRVLEPFRSREKRQHANRQKKRPAVKIESRLHMFDKRRMHYLKLGRTDQRDIGRLPVNFFGILHNKSRDEIEQTLMVMETELSPREYKSYACVIFELEQFFLGSYGRKAPQTLNPDKVDTHFIDQICRLNADATFWAGMKSSKNLHSYLVRYVLMFFDHEFSSRSFIEDYIRQFMNRHRDHRAPFKTGTYILKQASAAFGESREVLEKMSRKEIASLYRLKAMKLHPDKGGAHDEFVKLTEAYHELLKTKI
jgi:hypothetical protein